MEASETVRPHVKQNLVLIRVLLAVALIAFYFVALGARSVPLPQTLGVLGLLALSFVPFLFLGEERLSSVRYQYIYFSLDLMFLLGVLFAADRLTTPRLLCIFLTLFMSALSQSVGRAIAVALAVNGLYYYLRWSNAPSFDPNDPLFLLTGCLFFVVAIHSGYLAYRAVQEEKELVQLARKATFLTEKVREASQAGQEYAMTYKKVLDSLPLGALAVSHEGSILLVNAAVGKMLGINPRFLTNLSLAKKGPLQEIGDRMLQALQDRQELKREYLDMVWDGKLKRFRLDSTYGRGVHGEVWGMLFLLQEAMRPAPEGKSAET